MLPSSTGGRSPAALSFSTVTATCSRSCMRGASTDRCWVTDSSPFKASNRRRMSSSSVLSSCSVSCIIFTASLADAVAKRYRPWPKGLRACRGSTPPWSRARVDCGIQIKLKSQRPGHTGRKALATKKHYFHCLCLACGGHCSFDLIFLS